MSYGKEFQIKNKIFLIEKFDEHIYVAEKLANDEYRYIFEGDFEDSMSYSEHEPFKKVQGYDYRLYCMLISCLNYHGLIDSEKDYRRYIFGLLADSMTSEEILNSDSDEKYIYSLNFPIDNEFSEFKLKTEFIIKQYKEKDLI